MNIPLNLKKKIRNYSNPTTHLRRFYYQYTVCSCMFTQAPFWTSRFSDPCYQHIRREKLATECISFYFSPYSFIGHNTRTSQLCRLKSHLQQPQQHRSPVWLSRAAVVDAFPTTAGQSWWELESQWPSNLELNLEFRRKQGYFDKAEHDVTEQSNMGAYVWQNIAS